MSHRYFPAPDGQRRARAASASATPAAVRPPADLDALLALACEAGLLVTLDAQIGSEKYQSVAGSVFALQRFAAALCARAGADASASVKPTPRRKTRPGWPRLRNRAPRGRGRLRGVSRHARATRGAHCRRELRALRAA
ncbi:hypothetical protein KDW41_06440 [Burkholderia vietnamiensis]|nr:hypothetical protein [Burkholderia vietnamiensis]